MDYDFTLLKVEMAFCKFVRLQESRLHCPGFV